MNKDDLSILVVEDHLFQLRVTKILLESYGFNHITLTDSAQSAMQHMRKAVQPFDILLCDQCLPDLPGLHLIKWASALKAIKQAVLLSGLTSIELDNLTHLAKAQGLPLLGYLLKPLNQSKLRNLLSSTRS